MRRVRRHELWWNMLAAGRGVILHSTTRKKEVTRKKVRDQTKHCCQIESSHLRKDSLGSLWVVTGSGRQLDANAIGLALVFTRMGQVMEQVGSRHEDS